MERVKKAANVTSRVKRDLTNTTHYVPKPTPEYNSTPELQSYKRLCKGLDVKVRYEFVLYGLLTKSKILTHKKIQNKKPLNKW